MCIEILFLLQKTIFNYHKILKKIHTKIKAPTFKKNINKMVISETVIHT